MNTSCVSVLRESRVQIPPLLLAVVSQCGHNDVFVRKEGSKHIFQNKAYINSFRLLTLLTPRYVAGEDEEGGEMWIGAE